MHSRPKIVSLNHEYFKKLLTFKNVEFESVGSILKFKNYRDYNFLVDINSVFSDNPIFCPVDRTNSITMPFQLTDTRPWTVPVQHLSLSDAMCKRVNNLAASDRIINIFWSGGIDSTAIVTAFLKYHSDHTQIRIIYTPWSRYEHNEYLDFLKKFPKIKLINISDQAYLNLELDGIFISGNSGDESYASIDESFLKSYGFEILNLSWVDFFYKKINSEEFIEFCKNFFAQSGFEISTVLEARWWFYTICKINAILHDQTVPFLASNKSTKLNIKDLYGFFDCDEYESHMYWNIDSIMPNSNYSSWKQELKDFCYEFDCLENWHKNKTKFHSLQMSHYTSKKIIMNNARHIMILDNNQVIQTPNLPFFSKREFDQIYGNSLDYLINV